MTARFGLRGVPAVAPTGRRAACRHRSRQRSRWKPTHGPNRRHSRRDWLSSGSRCRHPGASSARSCPALQQYVPVAPLRARTGPTGGGGSPAQLRYGTFSALSPAHQATRSARNNPRTPKRRCALAHLPPDTTVSALGSSRAARCPPRCGHCQRVESGADAGAQHESAVRIVRCYRWPLAFWSTAQVSLPPFARPGAQTCPQRACAHKPLSALRHHAQSRTLADR
jgi:hypothetical protein